MSCLASSKQTMMESIVFLLFSLFFIHSVLSDRFIETNVINSQNNEDICTSECMRKVAIDSNNIVPSESCSRGCRFFTLAQLIEKKHDDGKMFIKETCKAMCQESYGKKGYDSTSCQTGCESTNNPPSLKIEPTVQSLQDPGVATVSLSWSFSWYYWFIDNSNSVQTLQGDISEPDDVLTDPSLRAQITKGETLRIPEIRLRTMPVFQDKSIQVEGGPTLCTGATVRGVQSCLVWSLLLLLTLVGLWSCIGEIRDHSNSTHSPLINPLK